MSDPYISLLKKAIGGRFNRENGVRIVYLLDCFAQSRPYDIGTLIDIGAARRELLDGIADDPDEHGFYKERVFGFPYSMLGQARLDNVEALIRRVVDEGIPGSFLEAGVWRGGTCILARALFDAIEPGGPRRVFVADSFAGLPPSDHPADAEFPFHLDPTLSCSRDQVRENFRHFDLDPDRGVVFVEGFFEDSLPGLDTGGLAILRADGDLHKSTLDILGNLYDQVVPGGFVIVDDYGALAPCREATDAFRAARGITAPVTSIDWTGIYWQKPS